MMIKVLRYNYVSPVKNRIKETIIISVIKQKDWRWKEKQSIWSLFILTFIDVILLLLRGSLSKLKLWSYLLCNWCQRVRDGLEWAKFSIHLHSLSQKMLNRIITRCLSLHSKICPPFSPLAFNENLLNP